MNLECPYCEKEISDPDEKWEQSTTYEHECPHCGKNFVFEVEYIRTYSANQADCLNGGEHKYKDVNQYGWPEPRTFQRCVDCDHEVHN